MMKEPRTPPAISFVMKLKGGLRIGGDDLWAYISFIIAMEVGREMELCTV